MSITTSKIEYSKQFANWTELLTFATTEPASVDHESSRRSASYGDYFTNTKTWEDAVKLATFGWTGIGDAISNLSDSLVKHLSQYILIPETRYAQEGAILDVARWLDGEPEHWMIRDESESTNTGNRVAHVVYNMSASAGVSTEAMKAKGAAIAALVRLLDFSGIRTELDVISVVGYSYYDGCDACEFRVHMKSASQDLDYDLMAFALAHPSMFRRIGFSILESFPKPLAEKYRFTERGHFSYPCDYSSDLANKYNVYIGSSMAGEPYWQSTEDVQEWILKQLTKAGVNLKETV